MDSIIRKYNYKLETGTVGTDDDNIANILYNINRLEAKASYIPSEAQKAAENLGEVFSMVSDALTHLLNFIKNNGGKVKEDNAALVLIKSAFDSAVKIIEEAAEDKTDTVKTAAAIPEVYKTLLDIVSSVLELDALAAGRA